MTEESESTEAGRPSAGVDKEVLAELLQEFPAFKVALGGGKGRGEEPTGHSSGHPARSDGNSGGATDSPTEGGASDGINYKAVYLAHLTTFALF